MYLEFDQLSPQARVWIYPMDRALRSEEKNTLEQTMIPFCKEWKSHNKSLAASFCLMENQFMVLAVDDKENSISGCAIDNSTKAIKKLQNHLNINFFNRSSIALWMQYQITFYPLTKLKTLLHNGILNGSTLLFNTLANSKKDLNENWKIPIKSSWLSKYIP